MAWPHDLDNKVIIHVNTVWRGRMQPQAKGGEPSPGSERLSLPGTDGQDPHPAARFIDRDDRTLLQLRLIRPSGRDGELFEVCGEDVVGADLNDARAAVARQREQRAEVQVMRKHNIAPSCTRRRSSRPMQGRLKTGDVLLTAGIGGVFVQFLLAIMPGDPTLGNDIGKGETADAGKFRCLPERKETPRIERGGEFLPHPLLGLRLRDAKASGDRIRDVKGDVHQCLLRCYGWAVGVLHLHGGTSPRRTPRLTRSRGYSDRSSSSGSTLAARRAERNDVSSAAAVTNTATPPNVSGSRGLTP